MNAKSLGCLWTMIGILAGAYGLYRTVAYFHPSGIDPRGRPRRIRGFMKFRVVKDAPDGWTTYAFPELDLQLESPARPQVGWRKWRADEWDATGAWSDYWYQSSHLDIHIVGSDCRSGSAPTSAESEAALRRLMANTKAVERLSAEMLPSKEGVRVRYRYRDDGVPTVTEAFVRNEGARELTLRVTYVEDDSEGRVDALRVMASVGRMARPYGVGALRR